MRELLATGYIGNLARQIVAAYLVEDLGIDWRIGADWFESTLLDYDPHSNWGQWARSAGVVPTNEGKRQRVGGTRYFDIALNLANDEAASYIRRWVPQLAAVTDSHVFAPWLLGDTTLGDYAQPPLCSASLQKYFEEVGQKRQLGSKGSKSHGSKGSRSGKGGKGLAAMTF
jgi:deoxyribodipyrimidine photo-lyase